MNHCYGDLDPDLVIDYRAAAKDDDPEAEQKRKNSFESVLMDLCKKEIKIVVFTCLESTGAKLLAERGGQLLKYANIERLYIDMYHPPGGIDMVMLYAMSEIEKGTCFKECKNIKNVYLTIREGFHQRIK